MTVVYRGAELTGVDSSLLLQLLPQLLVRRRRTTASVDEAFLTINHCTTHVLQHTIPA